MDPGPERMPIKVAHFDFESGLIVTDTDAYSLGLYECILFNVGVMTSCDDFLMTCTGMYERKKKRTANLVKEVLPHDFRGGYPLIQTHYPLISFPTLMSPQVLAFPGSGMAQIT